MKFADVQGLTDVDAYKKIREIKGKLFEAKMKNPLGQLSDPTSIREMRRDIARLNTVLSKSRKKKAEGAEQ